jgi:hypothetical protein
MLHRAGNSRHDPSSCRLDPVREGSRRRRSGMVWSVGLTVSRMGRPARNNEAADRASGPGRRLDREPPRGPAVTAGMQTGGEAQPSAGLIASGIFHCQQRRLPVSAGRMGMKGRGRQLLPGLPAPERICPPDHRQGTARDSPDQTRQDSYADQPLYGCRFTRSWRRAGNGSAGRGRANSARWDQRSCRTARMLPAGSLNQAM